MKKILICATVLCATSVPVMAKGGAPPGAAPSAVAIDTLRAVSEAKGQGRGAAVVKGGPTCIPMTIECNSTVSGVLQTTDCLLNDGTLADFWVFDGTAGDEVTIDMESDDFNSFLLLLDPTPEIVAFNDNVEVGNTDARILFQLDATGEWTIVANNLAPLPGDPGAYTLSLDCGGCTPDENTMCLNRRRFQVEIEWADFSGGTGPGTVAPLSSDDSGLYWFFSPDYWEVLVKVLDGCSINDHYWVFAAATTNVEYTLRVTDSETGSFQEYFNPLGVASPAITDTSAFASCP